MSHWLNTIDNHSERIKKLEMQVEHYKDIQNQLETLSSRLNSMEAEMERLANNQPHEKAIRKVRQKNNDISTDDLIGDEK